MRPLAFVDLETTGLDPRRHEIIEIAVVRADPRTFETTGMIDLRVRPGRIEDADPAALQLNGWSAEAWRDAVSLDVALVRVGPLLDGALLAGHNVSFDRAFLDAAWRATGVGAPDVDHHLLDTATLAWPVHAAGLVESLSLGAVCKALGIDIDRPHRALADAQRSLEVARRLLPDADLASRTRALVADERAIVETILARIEGGRRSYGPWRSGDGRDYPGEALAEVIDALNYCAAELVRLAKVPPPGVDQELDACLHAEQIKTIEKLKGAALRTKFKEVLGVETKSNNRPYLIKRIVDALDARAESVPAAADVPREVAETKVTARVKKALAAKNAVEPETKRRERDPRIPPPGTVIEREHDGKTVRVKVLEDGFEYDGQTYRSLSAIARQVTGCTWNGLLWARLIPYAKRGAKKAA